jgi:hypothetical protein
VQVHYWHQQEQQQQHDQHLYPLQARKLPDTPLPLQSKQQTMAAMELGADVAMPTA